MTEAEKVGSHEQLEFLDKRTKFLPAFWIVGPIAVQGGKNALFLPFPLLVDSSFFSFSCIFD